MKTKTLIIAVMSAMMLASCGITKNGDFASRKYTHFRKGEAKIEINTAKTDVAVTQNEVKKVEPAIVNNGSLILSDAKSETIASTEVTLENAMIAVHPEKTNFKSDVKEKPEIKFKGLSKMIMSRLVDKANTTSVKETNVDQVVLVILAIFIPPLAVALARGIGNEFWIDLLLTILFFLPGMIYALLIVLDAI